MQHIAVQAIAIGALLAIAPQAQNHPATTVSPAERGVELTRGGHCQEALPLLVRAVGHVTDKDLERRAGVAGIRCAMTLNQQVDVARFLDWMNHDFPHDPEVLYLAVHAYSDLSIRASQELMYTAPSSPQVHQLNAEAMETQGRWKEAMEEYRVVLQRSPNMPGIHYRIARLILSQAETPTTFDDAKKEMEAELAIDPNNAGAEYVLGEIARRRDDFPQAVAHFSRAAKLDAMFADAFVGWGRSLNSAEKYAEAIPPLEHAEKLQPSNPAPHFFLAVAYRHVGRREDAEREARAHEQVSQAANLAREKMQKGILAGQQVDGKDAQAQP
jgi:tetratricopeptide (TPR) repeat protein